MPLERRAFAGLALAGLLLLSHGAPAAARQAAPATDWAAYVDPFIGTGPAPSAHYGQEFDGGDVFPGAAYPSGMLYWSPDTVEHSVPGGYFYPDSSIKGFSLTHFSGRGCQVYLDVPIMPLVGGLPSVRPSPPAATFSHANESASPGAYSVRLDNGIQLDLGVTPRTGLGRIAWPADSPTGTLVVDAAGSVNGSFESDVAIDAERRLLTGHVTSQVGCGTDRYTLYFAIAFDHPFQSFGTWTEDAFSVGASTASGPHTGAALSFDTTSPLTMKPAISYVSVDNALANLAAEGAGWDVDAVRSAARSAWNRVLGRIEVNGGSAADLRTFYTALYHVFLHPNVFNDVNGQYVGFDDQVHTLASGHQHFHNIPGWDQYRSLVQIRTLLAPAEMSDILQSLVDDALQGGGGMPRWEQANRNSAGMVGDSPGAYVASAYAFGARDFGVEDALHALDAGASSVGATSGGHPVREYVEPWLLLGYVPDQPSITLEYAIDDFALGQLAAALGDLDTYQRYLNRADQWRNTFNPRTGYIESRTATGAFPNADHSHACCGFVEGNAAQYTWMVPFDLPGVIAALGGNAAAIGRLDDFFTETNAGPDRPHAWLGNEPGLWSPWAYNFAGAPARTQATVRRIQRELFDTTPGGLPGNDDGGATSSWFVFSALGLYPSVPGIGGFSVGSPVFTDVVVHLSDGSAELHIVGNGAAADRPYVSRLRLNGTDVTTSWIDWTALSGGATLEFDLSPRPPGEG